MVKHIVMWKIKESQTYGTKEEVMQQMKEALEGLKGQIEGVVELEVGINFNPSEAAHDIILNSVFTSKEALAAYQVHPKHVAVGENLVRKITTQRVVVDYEV